MVDEYKERNFEGEPMDWVKAEALRSFNISRRKWNNKRNLKLTEGETYILPRNGEGMKHYFANQGFLKIVDNEPNVETVTKDDAEPAEQVFECSDCGREFGSERGLNSHRSQKHKDNKNEDGEE